MISNQYNLYSKFMNSPVSTNSVNPVTDLMFKSATSSAYLKNFYPKVKNEFADYLNTIDSSMSNLEEILKNLSSKSLHSVFKKNDVLSSSNAISGEATNLTNLKSFSISVSNLASSQKNDTGAYKAEQKDFELGENIFKIDFSNGKSKTISFNVTQEDTNLSIMQKVSRKFIGDTIVNAKVTTDDKGYLKLSLEAKETGKDTSFTISDISGNFSEKSEISKVKEKSENANYKINNEAFTSKNNFITLDNGNVSLELKGKTEKTEQINIIANKTDIRESIESFLNSYNKVIEDAGLFKGKQGISEALTNVLIYRGKNLESVGIEVGKNGKLSLNSEVFNKNIDKNLNLVENAFKDRLGLGSKLKSTLATIKSKPNEYLVSNDLSKEIKNWNTYLKNNYSLNPKSYNKMMQSYFLDITF